MPLYIRLLSGLTAIFWFMTAMWFMLTIVFFLPGLLFIFVALLYGMGALSGYPRLRPRLNEHEFYLQGDWPILWMPRRINWGVRLSDIDRIYWISTPKEEVDAMGYENLARAPHEPNEVIRSFAGDEITPSLYLLENREEFKSKLGGYFGYLFYGHQPKKFPQPGPFPKLVLVGPQTTWSLPMDKDIGKEIMRIHCLVRGIPLEKVKLEAPAFQEAPSPMKGALIGLAVSFGFFILFGSIAASIVFRHAAFTFG